MINYPPRYTSWNIKARRINTARDPEHRLIRYVSSIRDDRDSWSFSGCRLENTPEG